MRVLVATIGKPFGVRGEVTLRLRTDEPNHRLVSGSSITVVPAGSDASADAKASGEAEYVIEAFRLDPPGGVLKLQGPRNRGDAEGLRGSEIWCEVSADQRPADDDEWYDHQLVGMRCESPEGEALGEVIEVAHHPAHDSLVVRTASGNRFVPFVSEIVPEVRSDRVIIKDPGGLLIDLVTDNSPGTGEASTDSSQESPPSAN